MAQKWVAVAAAAVVCACSHAAAPLRSSATTPTPVTLTSKTPVFEFRYGWAEEAAAIPALSGMLRRMSDDARQEGGRVADADARDARRNGRPFNPHAFEMQWSVVGNTARLLVLEGEGYTYTNGAHGLPLYDEIIWDKQTGKRVTRDQWLVSAEQLSAAARSRFCDALNAQRAERRGAPVVEKPDDPVPGFTRCPMMARQLLLPIGKGAALTAIRVIIGPYEAGPYAEGTYVVELPMTAGMMAAIAADYRSYFVTTPG